MSLPSPFAVPRRASLVAQTAECLRDALAAGRWREHLPGERELCRVLEVSRPTLRSALAELERDGTLQTMARARRRIRPHPQRRRTGRRVVAALSPLPLRALSPTTVLMIDALKDRLGANGWSLQFTVSRAAFSRNPAKALADLAGRNPAGSWMLLGSFRPTQEWFLRERLPCLVCGTCAEGVALPSVDADHHATSRHAAGQLRRKGIARVALVRADEAAGGDEESEQGFRAGWGESPASPLRILRHRSRDHLLQLLDQSLRAAEPPEGYFVLRAAHALTVTMHLLRRGLRLPQDAAVISRDNEAYLEHTSPLITRYGINPDHFALHVSRLVQRLVESDPAAGRQVRLMPTFHRGETL